ncbi:MAG: hypothetical protein FWD39_04610 [Clostridiales bacterium]|nr:hypothetical protein [Clostridiales bacterium]
MPDLRPALAADYLFELNIAAESAPGFAPLARGITALSCKLVCSTSDKSYRSAGEAGHTCKTGVKRVFVFEGERVTGDPAQDFVLSTLWRRGRAAETSYRYYHKERGEGEEGRVTLLPVEDGSFPREGRGVIRFEMHVNGRPRSFVKAPAV